MGMFRQLSPDVVLLEYGDDSYDGEDQQSIEDRIQQKGERHRCRIRIQGVEKDT